MAEDLEIRELAVDDLPPLLSLYEHLHPQDDPLPPMPEVERIWAELVADPLQIYLGGFVEGSLVSACNAAVIRNLTRGARPYAVIENVVTHAEHRGRGFARATLSALIERCLLHGCYKIMLLSGVGRSDAHGLYDALGFDRHAKQAFVLKGSGP